MAHSLGIPHFTIDASESFSEKVVEYFVSEYEGGRTPNPCAKCNSRVRFGLMSDLADRLGAMWVATGHYARLLGDDRRLARGLDLSKDQSYVLAEVDPGVLRRVLFPLGEMTKAEVRRLGAEAGLEGHAVPESQEICFVPDDDHRRFLRERLGELPGDIVDSEGRRLGVHTGTYNYTIGQRRGLGIASTTPLYVIGIEAARAEVVVGVATDLDVEAVTIGSLTRHGPLAGGGVHLQVRSAGKALRAHVVGAGDESPGEGDEITVVLDEPAQGVAPGQTAVIYEQSGVVYAGTILSTRAALVSGAACQGIGLESPVV